MLEFKLEVEHIHLEDLTSWDIHLTINNVSDNSERLRILHSAEATATSCSAAACIGGAGHTVTWINVTTAHTQGDIVDLPGTVVLNYDVSAPAALLSSTAVSVYVVDSGDNGTNNAAGLITRSKMVVT